MEQNTSVKKRVKYTLLIAFVIFMVTWSAGGVVFCYLNSRHVNTTEVLNTTVPPTAIYQRRKRANVDRDLLNDPHGRLLREVLINAMFPLHINHIMQIIMTARRLNKQEQQRRALKAEIKHNVLIENERYPNASGTSRNFICDKNNLCYQTIPDSNIKMYYTCIAGRCYPAT